MKISISYPPLETGKGVPLLSQNRQFQYFHKSTYIYPVVPAYAATLLKQAGHEVIWDDGIAEEKSYEKWLQDLSNREPDVIAIETKTPVVKKHWNIINELKINIPKAMIVLMGDHVTAIPIESFKNSKVDIVITGGDYDFSLLSIAGWLENKCELEPGIYYRRHKKISNTGKFVLNHDLNALPFIDRDLTKWHLYAYNNGNYKDTPGAYVMAGRDCWWRNDGGCTFCSWPTLYPNYRIRDPALLVEEIGMLISKYKVKEVFDDTGTFPIGEWLKKFCKLMIERGYNDELRFGCNLRFGSLKQEDYRLLRKAGCRMLLFGLESANQFTLDKLNKGVNLDNVIAECKIARDEDLEPHITIMVGYPWETRIEAMKTLDLAKVLMEKGSALTLQSTIVVPYPGSKLYDESIENDWFRVNPDDYDRFDMSEPVLKTQDMGPDEILDICDGIYRVFLSPRYMLRHLVRVRSIKDMKYSIKGVVKVLGHVKDFGKKTK